MKTVICPNCGAPVEIDETQSVFTCPFCSVSSEVVSVKEEVEHYIAPVRFNELEIRTQLIGDILKYPGAPQDLHKTLTFTKVELKYIPYWIISVTNRTEYVGIGEYASYSNWFRRGYRYIEIYTKPEQGAFEDEREFIIYAAEELNEDLVNFDISTRGKEYYQRSKIEKEKAEVVPSIYSIHQAKEIAINKIRQYHQDLIYKEVVQIQQIRDNPQIKSVYLLHVPFYFITFKVGKKRYRAILDASTGRTVRTDIPTKPSYIATILGISAALGIMGLIGLFLLHRGYIPNFGLYALITGIPLGFLTSIFGFRRRYTETRRK